MPRLILMFKDKILKVHPLTPGEGVTIGRHRSNHIIIDNLAVSGYHARLDFMEERLQLTDLQSKNGTFINGEPVSERLLKHNDEVTIGKHTLLVDLEDEIQIENEAGAIETDASGVVDVAGAVNNDRTMFLETSRGRQLRGENTPRQELDLPVVDTLLFLTGGFGEVTLAGKKRFSIGRNKDADIVISGLWALLVGGPAATINKQAGEYFLRYTGGLIKPKRNGAGVKGTVKLNHEDVVQVGPVKVQIQLSERAVSP